MATNTVGSPQHIIGGKRAGKAIEDLFTAIYPGNQQDVLSTLFTSESAGQYLDRVTSFSRLLDDSQGYEQALSAIDASIEEAEGTRDQVLAELYRVIRPVEQSYRLIQLFFENAEVRDRVQRAPVEFYVFNADTHAMTSDIDSSTIAAIDEFVQSRNDTFNFRQYICNLVVPGYVNDRVRTRLEDIANKWGMLLIGDLRDEQSFRKLSDQFRTDGGAYEFLKRPEDKAAADVVLAGYVKLRDRHWFEEAGEDGVDDADLYGPPSLVFAGALSRTDRTVGPAQGPVGVVYGKLEGVARARVEPRISEMEHLTMERQIVTIVRTEDNTLCFVGSRSLAEDPNGVLKFFTSYRVMRYIERRIAVYLRRVTGQRLTRDFVKQQVIKPIDEFLLAEKKEGTIYDATFTVDMDEDKFALGVLDMTLELMPVGPAERLHIRILLPEPSEKATKS